MKITVLTIFPDMFDGFLKEPVIRRAIDHGIVSINIDDIKKYAGGSYRHIDDDTYGGGAGMVMRAGPVLDALRAAGQGCVCVMTPSGQPYSQAMARRLACEDHLILVCGHYEGIDERVMKHADLQISIGDYVLTGGELPARVVMDSVIRLLDGVLRKASTEEESFEDGLLEYPQYTKPLVVEGEEIPEELQSGDHEKIRKWRKKEALLRTLRRRPDLLEKRGISQEEMRLLEGEKLAPEEKEFLERVRRLSRSTLPACGAGCLSSPTDMQGR